jgi:hypothetical protein
LLEGKSVRAAATIVRVSIEANLDVKMVRRTDDIENSCEDAVLAALRLLVCAWQAY